MKRALNALPAAMRSSRYYLRGYGTPRTCTIRQVAAALSERVTDGDWRTTPPTRFCRMATGKEAMQGLLLLALAIEQEYKTRRDSEVSERPRADYGANGKKSALLLANIAESARKVWITV